MHEGLLLAVSALVGVSLGVVFFGGLWWTVQRGITAAQPGAIFAGSFLLRSGLVVGGFTVAARGDWRRMVACLGGFIFVRISMLFFTNNRTAAKTEDL